MQFQNKLVYGVVRNLRPDRALHHLRHPWFSALKARTNGMLTVEIYRAIYNRAAVLPDMPFVEIGAASGTATIAIASAYDRTGKRSKILAVEKCHGGSRRQYGGYTENLAILKRNLSQYGVSDKVVLFTGNLYHETASSLLEMVENQAIAGFMHDADGRLDRDFALFWPRTIDGGVIIVDDCPAELDLEHLIRTRGSSGRKFYMAAVAWAIIRDAGLVDRIERMGTTIFARKPENSGDRMVPTDALQEAVLNAREEYKAAFEHYQAGRSEGTSLLDNQ